jgi:hypothetical protein
VRARGRGMYIYQMILNYVNCYISIMRE